MELLIKKSLLGAAIVFIINHGLFHVTLLVTGGFPSGEANFEGGLFGMFFNLRAYLIFIIINALTYIGIRQLYTRWPMWMNVFLLFVVANVYLDRFTFMTMAVLFYWCRYAIGLLCLLYIDVIIEKTNTFVKCLIVSLPPIMSVVALFLY